MNILYFHFYIIENMQNVSKKEDIKSQELCKVCVFVCVCMHLVSKVKDDWEQGPGWHCHSSMLGGKENEDSKYPVFIGA